MSDDKDAAKRVIFPTMLRKMWSGEEVQQWLDREGPFYSVPMTEVQVDEQDIVTRMASSLEKVVNGGFDSEKDHIKWLTEAKSVLMDYLIIQERNKEHVDNT